METKLKIIIAIVILAVFLFGILPLLLSAIGSEKEVIKADITFTNTILIRSLNGGKDWKNIVHASDQNPFPAKILHIAFHPSASDIIYFGGEGSGLWKSEDRGTSWIKLRDMTGVLNDASSVHHITFSRSNPRVLYIAESLNGQSRLLKSSNGGETFKEAYVTPTPGVSILDVIVNPRDASHVIFGSSQGGLIETRNGGNTWRPLRWFKDGITQLITRPDIFNRLFVVTSEGNLEHSIDGGVTWIDRSKGIKSIHDIVKKVGFLFFQRKGESNFRITIDPQRFEMFYTISSTGVYRSPDEGLTWERLETLIPQGSQPVFNSVAISPKDQSRIFATAGTGLHKTTNEGATWSIQNIMNGTKLSNLLIHPRDNQTMFAIFGTE